MDINTLNILLWSFRLQSHLVAIFVLSHLYHNYTRYTCDKTFKFYIYCACVHEVLSQGRRNFTFGSHICSFIIMSITVEIFLTEASNFTDLYIYAYAHQQFDHYPKYPLFDSHICSRFVTFMSTPPEIIVLETSDFTHMCICV